MIFRIPEASGIHGEKNSSEFLSEVQSLNTNYDIFLTTQIFQIEPRIRR